MSGKEIWSERYYYLGGACIDNSHIYYSNFTFADLCCISFDGKLQWENSNSSLGAWQIALDENYVYTLSNITSGTTTMVLTIYDKSGNLIHTENKLYLFSGSGLAVDDLYIYFTQYENGLYKMDKTTYTITKIMSDSWDSVILTIDDNNIYFVDRNTFYCISKSSNTVLWQYAFGTGAYLAPNGIQIDNSAIYVAYMINGYGGAHHLVAFSKSGNLLNDTVAYKIYGQICVDDTGIYLPCTQSDISTHNTTEPTLVVLDKTAFLSGIAKEKWTDCGGTDTYALTTITNSKNVFVSYEDTLRCLSK